MYEPGAMLLLEKQGRASQQQRMQETADLRPGSDGGNRCPAPSSLPRPPAPLLAPQRPASPPRRLQQARGGRDAPTTQEIGRGRFAEFEREQQEGVAGEVARSPQEVGGVRQAVGERGIELLAQEAEPEVPQRRRAGLGFDAQRQFGQFAAAPLPR
jgi:hypothetical protein